MTVNRPAISTDGFAWRLGGLYAGMFVALGVYVPFLPVWLAAQGLDATAIGIVLATPMVVRIFALPAVTGAADRWGSLRGVLMGAAIATPAGFALVGLADGFWPILIAISLASAAFTSIFPLADAYALKGLALRGRAYGPVRLWGSAAFICGSIGAGFLLDLIAPAHLIWAMVAAFLATALASLGLRPLDPEPQASASPGSIADLLRAPAFVAVVAAASLIQASHAVYYGFSTLDWRAAGFDGRTIGALWALGVVAEIVVFALSGRLPRLTPATLIGLGAAGGAVRWIAMALDPASWLLPPLQLLHGLSFGATHLGAVQFLAQAAPERFRATAQGTLSIAMGVVMAVSTALSGLLYGAYGSRAYAAMAAVALFGGVLALMTGRKRRNAGT